MVRGEWRTKKIMMLEDFRVCDRLLAPFSKLSPMFRPPKQNTTNNHFKIEIITSKAAVGLELRRCGACTASVLNCTEQYGTDKCTV